MQLSSLKSNREEEAFMFFPLQHWLLMESVYCQGAAAPPLSPTAVGSCLLRSI